ncbi:MAG: hypothetical protein Q9165_002347 [Trypethelium subeluteriae]
MSLLHLPSELRLQIYHLVLSPAGFASTSPLDFPTNIPIPIPKAHEPPLFRVSRRIRIEALPIFLSYHNFHSRTFVPLPYAHTSPELYKGKRHAGNIFGRWLREIGGTENAKWMGRVVISIMQYLAAEVVLEIPGLGETGRREWPRGEVKIEAAYDQVYEVPGGNVGQHGSGDTNENWDEEMARMARMAADVLNKSRQVGRITIVVEDVPKFVESVYWVVDAAGRAEWEQEHSLSVGLREEHSDVAICQALLEAVDEEFLQPIIFSIFLPWAKSDDAIVLCIHQGRSRSVRKQGIKHFGIALIDSARWMSAWGAIGGTKGLVDLFAKLSVAEVKALAAALGRCNRGQKGLKAREKGVEELLRALLPIQYPGSRLKCQDRRPIQGYYAQMIPACSSEFVGQLLDAKDQSNPLYQQLPSTRLIRTHAELLRTHVKKSISHGANRSDFTRQFFGAFVHSQPPRPNSQDPRISESMAFALNVLQHRLDINNAKDWPAWISEVDIWSSLFRRSRKKKLSETKIHGVFMLGLQLLQIMPRLKVGFQSTSIWSELMTRWTRVPELYEDLLVLALHLGLGGSQEAIGQDFMQALLYLKEKPELRWPLLRLRCLHIPKKGIDIDTVEDFKLLSHQPWACDVFSQLSEDRAIRLLKGLYEANPEYSFLQRPGRTSILSMQDIKSQRNFNAALLLIILQRRSEEMQQSVKSTVDELRKKAAKAREQTDRAQFAKAAAACAIASGSLDLYKETVTWQQRYIRDPLTVKVIFARDATMTTEGIDLLSAIPQPLSDNMRLADIAANVKKADEVLMEFHSLMYLAKREPSFWQPDWNGVTSLFGETIDQRVHRAMELQKHLQSSEADIYAAIWSGTLGMIEKVGVDFLREVHRPIRALLRTLPPTALAASTAAMLETGKERRQMKDRQPEHDDLELLSYECLIRLSTSEKPELAQKLVLQTILDRPDASSWHRQLLSIKFMNSLPAKDAREILLAFAAAIGEKLEEQSYVKVGEREPSKSTPSQSLVKVTTVKYLAQLLDNAEFISADAAIEVLLDLFKAGTHRDIRLATLDSLLSLLDSLVSGQEDAWKSNAQVIKIMAALETIIPIAGSVNERLPMRPEDWEEANETGTLPEIADVSSGLPPLLNAILTAPGGQQYPGLRKLQSEFVVRYLLPILRLSQMEHRKWIALFLARHKPNLATDDLPLTPTCPQLWDELVARNNSYIPQTVFEDFNRHIILTITPPANLQTFNESLRKNVNLRNTPEVQHWLSVFGQTLDQYPGSGTQRIVSMIHHDMPHPSISNAITFDGLLDMVSEHTFRFLESYERFVDIWYDFVRDLRPPSKITYPLENVESVRSMYWKWRETGRIALEKVLSILARIRDRHESEDIRSILPSTTMLQLWLLRYPRFPETKQADQEWKNFVKELENLHSSLLTESIVRWPQIAEDTYAISEFLDTDAERLRMASYIGEQRLKLKHDAVDPLSSALNLVHVALVMKLIEDGRSGLKTRKGSLPEKAKVVIQSLQELMIQLRSSPNGLIREKMAAWRKHKSLWDALMSAKVDVSAR